MKKILLFAAATATASMFFSSCNSCNGNNMQDGVMIESDSISMVNDSTFNDTQTFIFEGKSPMDGNAVADVVLAVSTINLHSDGTYTITTDYVDEGIATQTDNGRAVVILGNENDSTATIIELVSSNMYPSMNFMMHPDSSLVKVGKDGKPLSSDPSHKLNLKK